MSKEKLKPIYWLRNYLSRNYKYNQDKFLGKVLTIIDASISDKEQRKGIKNLIQNEFYGGNNMTIEEILFDYCKKYCPDTLPDKDKISLFLRQCEEPREPNEWDFEK